MFSSPSSSSQMLSRSDTRTIQKGIKAKQSYLYKGTFFFPRKRTLVLEVEVHILHNLYLGLAPLLPLERWPSAVDLRKKRPQHCRCPALELGGPSPPRQPLTSRLFMPQRSQKHPPAKTETICIHPLMDRRFDDISR